MYKPGSRFIIEVETVYDANQKTSMAEVPPRLHHLYRMKNFGSLVFDDWGLSNLERTYGNVGPLGIGCVCRISRSKPKDREELRRWWKEGWPEPNDPWMITEVEKKEDGSWTYHGIDRQGQEVLVDSTTHVTYLNLHFNTVMEWAKYDGPIG